MNSLNVKTINCVLSQTACKIRATLVDKTKQSIHSSEAICLCENKKLC